MRISTAVAALFVAAFSASVQCAPAYVYSGALLPLLVQAPSNGWVKVSLNRFSDVWTSPDLEPLYYETAPALPTHIISAWSGFAWDSNRGDLILYGGGHANYPGNDVYRWHSSNLQWERASLPSQIYNDPVSGYRAIDGVDHAPSAAHTYKNNTFLPIVDRFLTFGGAAYNNGGPYLRVSETNPTQARITGPYLFDPNKANGNEVGGTTGSHVQRVAPFPNIVGGNMWQNRDLLHNIPAQMTPLTHVDGCAAYATENATDVVYVAASNQYASNLDLYRYQLTTLADPTQDQMGKVGIFWNGTAGTTTCGYDATRQLFVRTNTNATPFLFWDLTSPGPANRDQIVQANATITALSSWLAANALDIHNCGLEFDPLRHTFSLWCGGTAVWDLAPPSGNVASGWTAVQRTSPSTAAPPTPDNGVQGKWRYAPSYDVFVALEDPNDGDVWIYKPAGWVQPNPAGNQLPTVGVTAPAAGAVFAPRQTVTLSASAADADGSIARVEFYVDGAKVGQSTSAPFTVSFTPLLVGAYTVSAVAVDNVGGMTASATRTFSVNATLTTTTLQQGASGYGGTSDTYLDKYYPTTVREGSVTIYLDGANYTPLVRFAIFQSEGGPVPDGAVFQSATLSLYKQANGGVLTLSAMLVPWVASAASWNTRQAGVSWASPGASASGADYAASADAQVNAPYDAGWMSFDVTSRLQQWSDHGGNNGWRLAQDPSDFGLKTLYASEYATDPTLRPKLAVVYAPPSGGSPPPAGSVDVALAANGGVASASSTLRAANAVRYVNDGQRSGAGWSTGGGGWADATPGVFPDWVQIVFNGQRTIDHVVVYSVQDNFQNPVEPTDSMTFTLYGMTAFDVQGWNGTAWVTLGRVIGNNLVKRTVSFAPFTTDRVRILANGAADGKWSRITEIEAWTTASTTDIDMALAQNGGVASASSTLRPANSVTYVNDGQRSGAGWSTGGGGWADATPGVFPDWVEIDLSGTKTLDHVVVYSVQDNFQNPVEPTDTMTFSLYGMTAFDVQGWNGTAWMTLGHVTGNNLVKRTVPFAPFATNRIRIVTNGVADGRWSRITEIEAWGQ